MDRDQIRLLARREIAAVLRRERRTWVHTVREEFATYYPLADLMLWLSGDPFVQIGRHAVVNLQAIEHVTHYGDRLYRVRLRDRLGTEITASRTGAARLARGLEDATLKFPLLFFGDSLKRTGAPFSAYGPYAFELAWATGSYGPTDYGVSLDYQPKTREKLLKSLSTHRGPRFLFEQSLSLLGRQFQWLEYDH